MLNILKTMEQGSVSKGSKNTVLIGLRISLTAYVFFLLLSCNIQGGRSHYILAERLFADQKYSAAIQEFKKVFDNDPKSAIAQQALFRMGIIQYLYLNDYVEAVKNFRQYAFLSQDTKQVYEAEKHIGEILFSKMEDYKASIEQYHRLIGKYPDSEEQDFFLYRMAKSYYHILKFEESVATFRRLIKERPQSILVEESLYQIGNALYTKGDYEAAIDTFEEVLVRYPKGKYGIYAQFGIATCYEELEQLDEAFTVYNRIKDVYPSKNVVELKLKRVKDRRASRKR